MGEGGERSGGLDHRLPVAGGVRLRGARGMADGAGDVAVEGRLAAIGNTVGGAVLVALLNYGQIISEEELDPAGGSR